MSIERLAFGEEGGKDVVAEIAGGAGGDVIYNGRIEHVGAAVDQVFVKNFVGLGFFNGWFEFGF